MTKPKNPEPNPIEKAIGDRAKDPTAAEKTAKEILRGYPAPEQTPLNSSPSILRDAPDQPLTQSEEVTLEELNIRT